VTSSVVVCAYTLARWDDLGEAVDSVLAQVPAPTEVLVVIDHNVELLERATRELSGVTVLANAGRPGLSGGRNTAIAHASGEVVVFLDDDAIAEPGWLALLLEHYEDCTVIATGGVARPRWPAVRPVTLPAAVADQPGELDWVVGCTYAGQPEQVSEVRNLMGCNMSFRASLFKVVGGFSEDLGRIGKVPLGCEETELCIRMRQADPSGRILFDPRAVVRHRVSPDRVRWKYLFARCYAEGVSKAAVSAMVGPQDALASERAYAGRVLPRAARRELGRAVRGDRAGWSGVAAVVAALATTAAGYVRGRTGRRGVLLGRARS
jgi:GT2 family glycosyltransferase